MQTQTKWTSEAGPRQTKAVNEAISKLNWRGKTRIELGDYGPRELVNVCGEPSEQSQAALAEIGETYGYTITRSNYAEIIAALNAATESLELPVDDCRSTDKEIQERHERLEKARIEREAQEQAAQESGAAILAKKPEWATALIVAELDENQSDSMTDYFAHKTTRRVAIGWRKGKREDFRQFRAAAATFEETKHLGPGLGVFKVRSVWADTCPQYTHCKGDYRPGYELDGETFRTREAAEQAIANSGEDMRLNYQAGSETLTGLVEYRIHEDEIEHRENYSMGAGYYLKAGCDDWDGWRVRSISLGEIGNTTLEDRLPELNAAKEITKSSAGYEVQKHYHTKRNCDIWAVVLAERVERAEFERLRDECKIAGGWFSAKWGAFPGGFCFATESSATEWAAKMFDSGSGAEQSPSEPPKTPNTADNLRSLADGMQAKIDERTRPMTQNYTPKRGREYNARMHDGENLKRCQKALRALADMHENGTCPDVLKGLRTKAQILPLVSTAGDSQGYYDYRDSGRYKDTSEQGKALQALIDETQAEREARELTYKLQELQRSNIEGFFPTPRTVALQMIELAEILPGMVVLEPSAGAGHLADVIREECGLVSINCCERMHSLREILKLKGHNLLNETDALEIRPQDANYDRILMNPPFENGQDADHTRKAYECLAENGRLVSVISTGLLCRSDRKATEFREWLDSVGGEVIELPAESFNTSEAFRRTGVSTALVVISK